MMEFIQALPQNEVLVGLVGGSVLLSVFYVFRDVPKGIAFILRRKFTVELVATNNAEPFHWLRAWMATTPYLVNARRLRLGGTEIYRQNGPGKGLPRDWQVNAGLGAHYFFYKGHLCIFNHEIQEYSKGLDLSEQITITTIGRSKKPLLALIEEAHALSQERVNSTLVMSWKHSTWCHIAQKKPRAIDTVAMDPSAKQEILEDIDWFVASRQWYVDRGIPYRRGYLLSGEPGTGKTSLITALAAHINYNLCVLNLGALDDDGDLLDAFTTICLLYTSPSPRDS